MKYLLIGSGHSAKQVRKWKIQQHIVATINHAWKIYPKFNLAFYAGDMPVDERPDTHVQFSKYQVFVSDLVSPFRNKYTWNVCRHDLQTHSETSLTMSLKWLLWYSVKIKMPIEKIGLIGCDLDYTPDEMGHTHFYGIGKDILERGIPDPFLKQSKDELIIKLNEIDEWAKIIGTKIVNYSDAQTIVPFAKEQFND